VRVLLSGGTGFLGRAIAGALVRRGHDVVVYSRTATRSSAPGSPVDGDVRDRAALQRAAGGCDAIVHTAALVSIWRRRREDFDEVNVGGLRNVLDVARTLKTPRVVYTSSFLALPPGGRTAPIEANDYQRTKVAADRLAEEAVRNGWPVVRVYPGVVYGPGALSEGNLLGRLIGDHLKRRLPGLIGPEKIWSFAYLEDVAAGHCLALERGRLGARYQLGGENAPQRRAFEIVEQITSRRPPARMPFAVARALGVAEELRVSVFGGLPLVTRGAVEIFRHDWPLDSADAVRDLGYTMTPLTNGLRQTVASLSQSAGARRL